MSVFLAALFFVTMAGVKCTIQERVFLLRHHYELNYDIKLLCEEFEQQYPNRGFPTRHTIYNMNQKFKCTGSVSNALHSCHPRDARTEENVHAVAQALSKFVLHNKNLVMQKKWRLFL